MLTWVMPATIVIFVMSIASCSTRVPVEELNLPLIVESKFALCKSMDGANLVEYWSERQYGGKIEVEWVSDLPGRFEIQGVSPIGYPLFRLRYIDKRFEAANAGGIANFLNNVSVNEEGYLQLGHDHIPIKIDEIPCFLSAKYPRTWLRRVSSKKLRGRQFELEIDEAARKIHFVSNVLSGKLTSDCSTISWRRYLFFRYKLKLCLRDGFGGELRFEDRFKISWQGLD